MPQIEFSRCRAVRRIFGFGFAVIGLAGAVHAAEPLYVGAGLGYAHTGGGCNLVDTATNTAVPVSSCDSNSTEGKFYVGYRFNDLIGIELGYTGLRDNAITLAGGGSGKFTASGIPLEVVVFLQGPANLSWILKLGIVRWSAKVDSNFTQNASDSGFSYVLGGGAEYNFANNIAVRGELEYFPKIGKETTVGEGNVTLIGVSVKYSF